jgi:Domain of unknown function (DU1801)
MAGKKTNKIPDPQQVAIFLEQLQHPLKEEILAVRQIILNTNDDLNEHIKWNAPSYFYNGDDRITFNFQGKGFFRLIFHCGVQKKEKASNGRLFEDTTGLLEWVADDRAVMKFMGLDDVKAKGEALIKIIHNWIAYTT